jgi:hypothetical protein
MARPFLQLDDFYHGCRVLRNGVELWRDGNFDRYPKELPGYKPRRVEQYVGSEAETWSSRNFGVVAKLLQDGLGSRIDAWHGRTGDRLWSRKFPLPRPTTFTDPRPTRPDRAEELYSFLVADRSVLIYCVQRCSRRTMHTSKNLPPPACQLDMQRLDPRTGESVWATRMSDVDVDLVERNRFVGLHTTPSAFRDMNWRTGQPRDLCDRTEHIVAWPIDVGGRVLCAEHSGKLLHLSVVDRRSRNLLAEHTFACKARSSMDFQVMGEHAILNLDAQTYVLLGTDFRPLRTFSLRGWFVDLYMRERYHLELYTTNRHATIDIHSTLPRIVRERVI